MYVEPISPVRPILRGRLHQVAFFASLAGLIWLVESAPTPRARIVAWVYGVASVLLYLTSSSYHVFARSVVARRLMRRADHAMIFVLIAGSFTPIAVLAVPDPWKWPALATVWAASLAGMALKICAIDRFPKLGAAMYIVVGWGAAVIVPTLWARPMTLTLIAVGGLLYTAGAILFALNRPVLSPRWFGYHEMWHAFGIAAGGVFFAANLGLVRAG